ncbi:MAG: hypothetical protein H8E72_05745 [Candidatus Marinimicrobia bacterium]|nr:hypothetical protein [Candidatus Neomarinimicrobiota bacterium]
MPNPLIKSHLETAIKSDPHFGQAYYELAKISIEEQNIKLAIKLLKNAINSGLKKTSVSKKRGGALLKKRQFPQAKRHMFKMGLSKYNTSIYFSELAQIYLDLFDLVNAEKYALYSLDEYTDQSTAMYILGCIHASHNRWEKAGRWFIKSLEINFKNAATHLSLAQVKQKQKKSKDAIHHYLIAKDLDQSITSTSLDKLYKKYPEL